VSQRLRALAAVAFIAAGLVVLSVAGGQSPSFAGGSFDGEASGSPVDSTISNPQSLPLGLTVELGGPVGQAHLTSFGQSTALAAFPNPGPDVAGLPGLAQASGAPVPSDPLYVTAANGQPPQQASEPGVTVSARADAVSSSGDASTVGAGGQSTQGQASVVQEADGTVLASASAHADALALTDTLIVQGLDCSASATLQPSGRLDTHSSLSIGRLRIGNASFGFNDGAFTLAGSSAPVPWGTALAQFKAAGIDATYQQPRHTAGGIIGADLQLSFSVPGAPVGVPTPTQITYTLGEVDASVTSGGAAEGSGTGASTGPASTGSPGSQPSDQGSASVPAEPSPAPAPITGSGAPSLASPAEGSSTNGLNVNPAGAGVSRGQTGGITAVRAVRTASGADLYLVIVAAALIALGAAQGVRLFGVRLLWN
jgi:hypothetical protein